MLGEGYSPEQVIADLRGFGFQLFIGEDGVVHGKPRVRGTPITLEMRAVIDRLQSMNDQVAAALRAEPERLELVGIPAEEALKWGRKIKEGGWRLIGKLVYHRGSALCDLTVEKVET